MSVKDRDNVRKYGRSVVRLRRSELVSHRAINWTKKDRRDTIQWRVSSERTGGDRPKPQRGKGNIVKHVSRHTKW